MMTDFPSITVLLPKLKNGDSEAWHELISMYQPGLIAKGRQLLRNTRIQRRVDAEELVNITFTKAWDRHTQLAAQSTREVAAYLLTTLQRTFIDVGRPLNNELSNPSWFVAIGRDNTPSAIAMSDEDEVRLHAALAEVSEKQRKVLVMRHFEGLKFREIGEKLGITTGAAAGAARDGLRTLTERMRTTSSPGTGPPRFDE